MEKTVHGKGRSVSGRRERERGVYAVGPRVTSPNAY